MGFNPIVASHNILDDYLRYIETTFFIKDAEYFEQFKKALKKDENFSNGPFLDVTDSFESGRPLEKLIEEKIVSSEFRLINSKKLPLDRALYKHQEESIIKVDQGQNVVITTGTGSGKTESFLLPIINYLLKQKENKQLNSGVRALIIYPMNALANDQMKRMYELFENYPHITFGAYTGETEHSYDKALKKYKRLNDRDPLPNELISREQMKENPPHILITNYAMLEYLMIRPEDSVFFDGPHANEWKYVVLDEAHTYTGATGIEVAMLLRRLKAKLDIANSLQFLLTSATLGNSIESNPDILHFARTLCCDANFDKDGIIRAKRIKLLANNPVAYPIQLYLYLAEVLDNCSKSEIIYEIIKKYTHDVNYSENISEILYDLCIQEKRYYKLKNILNNTSVSVEDVAIQMNMTADDIAKFVSVLSKATKNNISLFDARYHYFIRMLEGCYISLNPKKKLFIHPIRMYQDQRVFKFSVCRECGEIYLLGIVETIIDEETGKRVKVLKQPEDKTTSESKGYGAYLLLGNEYKPNDQEKIFTLCSKCGAIENSTNRYGHSCTCGDQFINYVYKVEFKKQVLHRCEVCDSMNTKTSILRDFYMGQEAAASVLGTSLYAQLPSKEVKVIKHNNQYEEDEFGFGAMEEYEEVLEQPKTKQFLIFSDSRQDAAYFSSYFDFTYHNILRRRLLVQTLQENSKRYGDYISISELMDHLTITFDKYHIFNRQDRKKEALKTILYEIGNTDRNSLENLGLLSIQYQVKDLNLKVFPGMMNTIAKVLFDSFRKQFRLYYQNILPLTEADREYFTYSKSNQLMCLDAYDEAKQQNNVQSWCSHISHINSRANYIQKISKQVYGNAWDMMTVNKFLTGLWNRCLVGDNALQLLQEGYQLKVEGFKIYSPFSHSIKWYRCNKCGKVTTFNVVDICPEYRCQGSLQEFNVTKEMRNNHYYRLYSTLDISNLVIKEHTAQLDIETAKDYQEKFVKKEINILSCSTTFEMGVDVGDLETVFMKNMPPTPANYIQRAGRAGRGKDVAAYALTFCKLSSHDVHFFNNPIGMIKGNINPPMFKLENDKILKRHLNAFVLAAFFKKYPESFKNVEELFLKGYIDNLKQFVSSKRQVLVNELETIIPQIKHNQINEWLDEFVSSSGVLERVSLEMKDEVHQLEQIVQEIRNQKIQDVTRYDNIRSIRLINSINTIKREKILSFLSRKNIIPKYGFPVDSVELITLNDSNQRGPLRLSRDLSMAISEYAPDSKIIANGNIYTSRYIKKPLNSELEWNLQDYGTCQNAACQYVNVMKHTFDENREMPRCRICGENVKKEGTFLIPEYGFITDEKVEVATTRKPDKSYRGDIIYIGDQHEMRSVSMEQHLIGNKVFTIRSTANDELLVLNRSQFYVCEFCGYTKLSEFGKFDEKIKVKGHKTPYGRICNKQEFKKRFLGHKFKTDVLYILTQETLDKSTALSVLYSLIEGVCRYLNIERNDISGCINSEFIGGEPRTGFVLFDNVPGGAGHVRRIGVLESNKIQEIFKEAYNVVNECKCGGDSADAACYSCLCNYQNQRQHEQLSRKLAIQWLSELVN